MEHNHSDVDAILNELAALFKKRNADYGNAWERQGVNVELGVTLHAENETQWPKIQAFAEARNIKIDMRSVYPSSNVVQVIKRNVVPFNHCAAVLYQLYIGSHGDIYPCCITQGDTKDHSFVKPFGYINDKDWESIWDRVIDYSERDIKALPSICRTCCVQRLSEINHICDSIKTKKSFF